MRFLVCGSLHLGGLDHWGLRDGRGGRGRAWGVLDGRGRTRTLDRSCGYNGHKMTVTIHELKNRLSEYLRRVQAGEQLVVTDHGRPVATIQAVGSDELTVEQRLTLMVSAGEMTEPRGAGLKWTRSTVIRGRPLSRTLLEDRG